MPWEPRVLATGAPGKSLPVLLEDVFVVLFLRVDGQAGFFLSPWVCHHGIIAQALELNGPKFEYQVNIFYHTGQDTYLYESHL